MQIPTVKISGLKGCKMIFFQIISGSQGFWRLELHQTSCTAPFNVFLLLFIYILKQFPIDPVCLREHYDAVLLSGSKNVDWP